MAPLVVRSLLGGRVEKIMIKRTLLPTDFNPLSDAALEMRSAHERFNVRDFDTIDIPGQPGTPRIDYLGEISTGYRNRPYSGNTAFVRLPYLC